MNTLIRLSIYVKKHWVGLTLSFLCLAISAVAGLIIPRVLGQGIDSAVKSGLRSTVVIAGIQIVVVSVITALSGYGNRFLSQVVAQRISYDLRNDLYAHLQKMSFAYYDKAQTGEIMSRATVDIDAVRMFLSEGFLDIIRNLLMLVGIAILLLILDWRLALMTLAFMPPIAWITMRFHARIRPMWRAIQKTIAIMGTTLQESLMGIKVVKAFSRQKEESKKFKKDADKLYSTMIDTSRQMAINMPMMFTLLSIPTAVVIWFGGSEFMAGRMTIGDVTQFILYLGMLTMPIQMIGMVVGMYTRSVAAGNRILEIMDTASPVTEKPGAVALDNIKGKVSFENVSFKYNEKVAALQDVSFTVEPGQLVALVGGSGSGKSTLANLISRFYDVNSGRITVDGVDIRDVKLDSLRRHIAIAQQDVFLFSASLKDNIAYGVPDASMEQVIAAAKTAQIHDFIMNLPNGYKTWTGERGLTLSGGEKQRVAIARTLLTNPSVLILDDSTSSVDARTEQLIRKALDGLIKGRTVFIITHRLPIIQNADLILVLKNGELVEKGKHSDLMANNGVYKEIYTAQLQNVEQPEKSITEA
jgi:ABC-type multidrug transport system fused ATPase/permease subunit